MKRAWIAILAPLPAKEEMVQGIRELQKRLLVETISSVYEATIISHGIKERIFSVVLAVKTDVEPHALYELLYQYKKKMQHYHKQKYPIQEAGQKTQNKSSGNSPNSVSIQVKTQISIELLYYEHAMIAQEGLHVPFLHLETFDYLLYPLVEIAPDLVHPYTGKPYRTYCNKTEIAKTEEGTQRELKSIVRTYAFSAFQEIP
ncbi:MAG: hypothetical protein QW594_00730 [Candidatus Woesearchaeota archaeon]